VVPVAARLHEDPVPLPVAGPDALKQHLAAAGGVVGDGDGGGVE